MKLLIVTAFLGALAGLPVAAADKEFTDVKVVVTDAQKGSPIARAAVTLKFIRGKNIFRKKDRAEWDVRTNSQGQVAVPAIPAGKLRVLVVAKGYQTFGEDFDVSGDQQTISVKLGRPADQYSAHETPEERAKKQAEALKKQQ